MEKGVACVEKKEARSEKCCGVKLNDRKCTKDLMERLGLKAAILRSGEAEWLTMDGSCAEERR